MTENTIAPAEGSVDEVTLLVARLLETHARLQELAGGEVDAVLLPSGQSFLLQEAQEKLRQNEAELRYSANIQSEILNALPALIALLDHEGGIVAVNEGWRSFAARGGMQDSAAGLGANYLEICDRAEGDCSAGAAEAAAGIRSVLAGEADNFSLDYPCPTPDKTLWFRLRVAPLRVGGPSGAVIMHVDITESKLAEAVLRERESELRSLAEAMPQMVWITRADGWTSYFSQRWMDYTGLTLEESLGRGWIKPFHPDDKQRAWDEWAHATETVGRYSLECRLRRADGDYRWWLIRGVPHRDASGEVSKWYGTCTDIHNLKVATEALQTVLDETERQVEARTAELAAANTRLRDAVERADAANLAKSQFLSRMSHELRTPMNAVLGYAQLLDRKYKEPEIQEYAGAILRGGRHLLKLIDELLDIGRVESGEVSVSVERVAVEDVLNHALTMVRPTANSANIKLSIQSETCRGVQVEADRGRLAQVLINLLGNAVKYNRPDGQVVVTCASEPNGLSRIEVSDTGFGISADDQLRLFQPFQRFGDLGIEGTGLGLALSYRLVDIMGGRLGLAHSSERGSTFFVELKTAQAGPGAMVEGDPAAVKGSWSAIHGTVLCVEDSPANQRLIEAIFSNWEGVSLTCASRGTIALKLARSIRPTLILLDLQLPDISGESVLHQLKADPNTAEIPVVILSADATPSQIKSLLADGAAAYLTKPLDLSDFSKILHQFLAEK
jgi:PAS domain S-box-containing protein